MIKKRAFLTMFMTLIFGMFVHGQAESILFHIKTALDKDDAQICVAPNVALAAQKIEDKVVILVDASAVTSFTKGWGKMNFGEQTPLDKAALPQRERESLAKQLKIPLTENSKGLW